MLNFPSPESDYALLPLIAVTCLTTVPLWFLLLVKTVKNYLLNRKNAENSIRNDKIPEKFKLIKDNDNLKSNNYNLVEIRNETVKEPFQQKTHQSQNSDTL